MTNINLYTDAYLDHQRDIGDVEVDLFVKQQFESPQLKVALRDWMDNLTTNITLTNILTPYAEQKFIARAYTLPEWANTKMLKAGAVFFAHHSEAIMSLLGLLSLPYCYAAADGAMVLYLSERLRNDTGKRLFETASFVWDVMAPNAFELDGKGFSSILKVRLMHAAARAYILKSSDWDVSKKCPVNQEDMAGTNLSFSLIVVRGLRQLGFSIAHTDQQAFLHLWNVIGFLLGVDEKLLPAEAKQAQALEMAIRRRHFKASVQGRSLTKSLTDFLTGMSAETGYPAHELLGLMRYLLGNEVSTIIGIDAPMLSEQKIRLLKTINLMKDLKPLTSRHELIYQHAYSGFKHNKGYTN